MILLLRLQVVGHQQHCLPFAESSEFVAFVEHRTFELLKMNGPRGETQISKAYQTGYVTVSFGYQGVGLTHLLS